MAALVQVVVVVSRWWVSRGGGQAMTGNRILMINGWPNQGLQKDGLLIWGANRRT